MESSARPPMDPKSRRRVRGLEWLVIVLLAVVELAAVGSRDAAGDPGEGVESVDSLDGADSLDGTGLAAETP